MIRVDVLIKVSDVVMVEVSEATVVEVATDVSGVVGLLAGLVAGGEDVSGEGVKIDVNVTVGA